MRINKENARSIIAFFNQLSEHCISNGCFARTTTASRKAMSIRINADWKIFRYTYSHLELRIQERLGWKRRRDLLNGISGYHTTTLTHLRRGYDGCQLSSRQCQPARAHCR